MTVAGAPLPEPSLGKPPPARSFVPEIVPPASGAAVDVSTHALRADNLRKSFRRRPVVRGVSVTLPRGKAVGLLGPNGAGKTTTFNLIAGLLPLDGGRIMLNDTDVSALPMYRRARLGLGYLPQESSIFRGLSAEDNIRAILEITERDHHRRAQMLDELLAEFSLTHLRRADSTTLSGGERRRLEIARSLASRPEFLLLDEPFAGVDPKSVNDMRDLVAHLKDRGIGVLITDHNARDTLNIVDWVYVITEGEVLTEGTPEQVSSHPDVKRLYLGEGFLL